MSAPSLIATPCELVKSPKKFHGTRVRVTGFIDYGFEDFTLWDPSCAAKRSIWVTYGGAVNSGTIYCCPGEGIPRNGIAPDPLIKDRKFDEFDGMVKREHDTMVRVTLVGKFLNADSTKDTGYGHMGCCHLFVIERIESFDPHVRDDLDYSASQGFNDVRYLECEGSGYAKSHYPVVAPAFGDGRYYLKLQRQADSGSRAWSFSDPERVALEVLRNAKLNPPKTLTSVKATSSRIVYEWTHDKRLTTVVVTKPYWLSLFARTTNVAWVVTAASSNWCAD